MRNFKYLLVFVTGMTTLAAEFGASRLLQNIYGSSNFVWATIIGLIMVYFAIGYQLGGKVADKYPNYSTLYQILIAGSFFLGIVPFISMPILRTAAGAFDYLNFPIMAGAFVSTIILFSLPIILLATTTPYVIRLESQKQENIGSTVGQINAISTIGSVFGAFLPSLFLFGLIGTTRTIVSFSLLMMAISIIGYFYSSKKVVTAAMYLILPLIIILLTISTQYKIKQTGAQIYEGESDYNYIEVLQIGDDILLRLNEGQGFHSQYNPTTLFYNGPWEQFLVAPMFSAQFELERVDRMAIVGFAAGTTALQAKNIYPNVVIDGIEIDPKIVEVGEEYFHLTLDRTNLLIGDGRAMLDRSENKYDLIVVDAYRPPYIPPHLSTVEFFEICKSHLTKNGLIAINVGRAPNDRRLINDLSTTLNQVLPNIFIIDIPDTMNSVIVAGNETTSAANFYLNYLSLIKNNPPTDLLVQSSTVAINNFSITYEPGKIYTDDLNPIEWATNNLVLNFVLNSE
jgi:spermidine synthase